MITLDVETELSRPFEQAPRLVCVATDGALLRWDDERIASLLLAPKIVGHSIAYDLMVLAAHNATWIPWIFAAYDEGRISDTQIRQRLIDIAHGASFVHGPGGAEKISYSLEFTSHRYGFGGKSDDTWRLRYAELRDVPIEQWPESARVYPLRDVAATREIWIEQDRRSRDLLEDEPRQCRAAFALRLMSAWGLMPDKGRVQAFIARYQHEAEKLRADLVRAGLVTPARTTRTGRVQAAKRNTKEVQRAVLAAYGDRAPRTATGVATDALTCAESGSEILVKYARYSSVCSILSKDAPLLSAEILHSRYEIADTGRSTSSGPNTQNFSRSNGMRECITPRPGFVFASADYGKLELCTLAQTCLDLFGWSKLADALNAGEDPHLSLAAQILGISYAEALAKKNDPDVDNARQTAKVANFGFPGGLGISAFVGFALATYDVRISEDEARKLKRAWSNRWPEMALFFEHVNALGGNVLLRRSRRLRGRCGFTDGCNTHFQGLGADVAKDALYRVVRATFDPSSPLFGSHVVNFIHDEIFLETPAHRAHEAAEELSRIMIAAARDWLPDVKIEAEPVVSLVWSKRAKPKRDESGRLIPWSDR